MKRRPGVVLVAEQLRRRVPGGIGTYATGLVEGLCSLSAGEAPEVVLYASRARTRRDPLGELGLPVAAAALPGPLLVRAWDHGLWRAPDAAVTHAVSLAAPPAHHALVVTVHDLAWRRSPDSYPPRGRAWHEAALARALRRATAFVVPSEPVARDLADAAAGLDAAKVTVIEHGCDHLPVPDREGAAALLKAIGARPNGYLLAVGTLEPRKNLVRLLEAYRLARPALSEPWPLVVVGPPGWGAALRDIPEGVLLAGTVGAGVLAGLYGGARCVAYVPLTEGFGLPVVEAMAAGAPVVSSDVPSARGATELVEASDVDSIAAGLVVVARDGARRDALVAAGAARVAGATWSRAARAHVELWRALGGGGGD